MDDKVLVASITAPHGTRGEVRLLTHTDSPEQLADFNQVWIDENGWFEIETARRNKQLLIVKFRGIDDMNSAGRLRGKLVYIERRQLPVLPPGKFYWTEIIGLQVINTANNEILGKVCEILNTGSNDVYIVDLHDGSQLLVPALKNIVQSINVAAGYIKICSPAVWNAE